MAQKILFVNQEISPYVPETVLSVMGRDLPSKMQEEGLEIRTFMPKWGNINERRGQLHEVIRLSCMNLVIDRMNGGLPETSGACVQLSVSERLNAFLSSYSFSIYISVVLDI